MIGYGKRVLLVDDDESMRKVAAMVLEDVGFTVVPACDGLQALEELHKRRFDAVVTDLEMPFLNGLELLTRTLIAWPDIPVIIVSGTDGDLSDLATARGAFAWIQKPFDPCLLWDVLTAAVEGKVDLSAVDTCR